MNILYIITILAVYILFMLIHKTEKKQNILTYLAISCILILCYNILICLMLTLLGISSTLGSLSICNISMIVILSIIILKYKKIQKYYFKISDFIFAILLFIVVIFIAYKQYGFPFNIKYEITDASTHYFFAQQFYEKSTLLYNETTNDLIGIYNSDFRLPGAYINEGILFKVFDNIINKIDLFIIFDLFVLYMSGILFYYLLKAYAKNNKNLQVLAIIFSMIYMLGYQLNSMLYGYVYLSLALDIIIVFLLLMANIEKEEISNKIALPILSLVSFGIFFSYAYFIPIIYIAVIINIIIKSAKNKEKILSISNIILMMYIIIIPLILGATYFIIFPLVSGINSEISTIGTEGYIYENYITNYLPLIPVLIIYVISLIKNKAQKEENGFPIITFMLSIIFAMILFIGNKLGIVSKYYFFKAYYIIWLVTIYNTYIALSSILYEKNKKLRIITSVDISVYLLAIIVAALLLKKDFKINNVFYHNQECINNEIYLMSNGEIEIINKMEDLITTGDIYILAPDNFGRVLWTSVLCNNQYIYIHDITDYKLSVEEWLIENDNKYYFAYYEEYKSIENSKSFLDENSNKYKIIHNDKYGFILERK